MAKALAFKQCLDAIEEHTKKTCWEPTGMSKKDFTAKHLTKMGSKKGQSVTGRAVQKDWAKAKLDGNWFPGKKSGNKGGRPPQIIQAQKQAIASKAMEPKDEIIPPTPDKIRICLPRKTINKEAVAASEGTEGRQAPSLQNRAFRTWRRKKEAKAICTELLEY